MMTAAETTEPLDVFHQFYSTIVVANSNDPFGALLNSVLPYITDIIIVLKSYLFYAFLFLALTTLIFLISIILLLRRTQISTPTIIVQNVSYVSRKYFPAKENPLLN